MSALPLIQPETASGEVAGLLATAHATFGITPNLTKVMANSPAVLRGYLGLVDALRAGELPPALRVRVALLVAQENGCDYCLSAHTYVATKVVGLSPADAGRARQGRADDPRTAAALAFATAVVRTRGGVSDGDLAAARAGGLSNGQLTEVIAHVALNSLTNYLGKATRLDIDWPFVSHQEKE